jgi:antitoxin VapB
LDKGLSIAIVHQGRDNGGAGGTVREEMRYSKQDAVRLAVQAELKPLTEAIPLRERIAVWRREHPMPPPTGQNADKAFFDDLSGEP